MNSTVLVPYCPLPANTGSRIEMWKHLDLLKAMGSCTILSAAGQPVGAGWTNERRAEVERKGFFVSLREEFCGRSAVQLAGIGYAAFFKALGMDRVFGHSNPYHRFAFPEEWWSRQTADADLAVINYSYFARLKCSCPKVVVLHDLLSDHMWEGSSREVDELNSADLVVVISIDEQKKLNGLGVRKTLWSPPAIQPVDLPVSNAVGCIGSANRFNVEGIRWLENAVGDLAVRIYGGLASAVQSSSFEKVGRYDDPVDPYRDCGIILLPVSGGTGVQIKAIEALAYGRAIVARKGAMRGLPEGGGAWLEVGSSGEMADAAVHLRGNEADRLRLAKAARAFYDIHLASAKIISDLKAAYSSLAGRAGKRLV